VPPVWIVGRAYLRSRLLETLVLAGVVGLAAGVVLAALAGASRTESSMRRFVRFSRPADLVVTVNGPAAAPSPAVIRQTLASRAQVQRLPEVAAASRAPYVFASPDREGRGVGLLNAFAAGDDQAFRTVNRALVLRGRLADPRRPDEAVVEGSSAEQDVDVGDHVSLWTYSAEQSEAVANSGAGRIPPPAGPRYTLRIVGVVRRPSSVYVPPTDAARDVDYLGQRSILLTPAFLRELAGDQHMPVEAFPGMERFSIRLRHGLADLPAFERGVRRRVAPGDGRITVGSDIREAADAVQRPIHVEAVALLLFGLLAALAAAAVLGRAVVRHAATDAGEDPTLAALGLTRLQRMWLCGLRAVPIGLIGAATAIAVAVGLSPLTPIGLARRAEIDAGASVNVAVLGGGALVLVIGAPLAATLGAWRRTRSTAPRRLGHRPAWASRPAAAALEAGFGHSAIAGAAMLFQRRRGATSGVAMIGAVLAVTGVVGALTFGASLRHLVGSPRQQGWGWDVVVGNPNSDALNGTPAGRALHDRMVRDLAANREVATFTGFTAATIRLDGQPTTLVGLETEEGRLPPVVVQGRAPRAPDELVVGQHTLDRLRKEVGQEVVVEGGGRSARMRIVGVALQPTAGDLSTRLAEGAAAPLAALTRLGAPTDVFRFAVRYRAGADEDAAYRSLVADFGREVLRPYPGGEVGDLARVEALPYILAAVLAGLGMAAVGLSLVAALRRHRRDLAVLKTLGFVRREVAATVRWQALVVALTAAVFGLPGGVAVGRWTWRFVANGIGSVSPAVVPIGGVILVAAATFLVAMLLAAGPGWAAAHLPAAEALRTE
jgi:hypothetical protein